ncbi:hypothetical protein [Sporosarcina luteola]|nr:hypothetical protein [Sporosarcina luteola]
MRADDNELLIRKTADRQIEAMHQLSGALLFLFWGLIVVKQ